VYLYVLDLVGVAVFAISGALAAGRRRLDLIGVLVLAAVTAVGGGTVRDLLLDRHPIFWLADARYLFVIIVAALATVLYVRWGRVPWITLDVADALGLALFSIVGTQVAERTGLPALSCILLGAVTGAAGGAIRDVLTARVPLVLQQGSLYAAAAIAGTSLYVVLARLGLERSTAALAGMAVIAGLRLAAIWWGLELPVFEVRTAELPTPPRAERNSREPEHPL
jgi:uncharacterized membrane protein YeiH